MSRLPVPQDGFLSAPLKLSRDDVVLYCIVAGFRGEALVTAVAVSQAESGFDAHIRNPAAAGAKTSDGRATYGDTVGLFQVRTIDHPEYYTGLDRQRDVRAMLDPQANAKFAYALSKGGKNFGPWSAYTNGSYRKYVEAARIAALRSRPGIPGGVTAAASVNPVTNEWIDQGDVPEPIVVGGGAHPGDLGNSVISAGIDFSMTEASLATFEFEDEDATLLRTSDVDEGSALVVLGDRHIVTSIGVKQGPASPHFTVTSQPAGVVRLRGVTPVPATATTAVDYVRGLARAAGLDFIGGPATPTITVTPAILDPNSAQVSATLDPASVLTFAKRAENAWEVARRLATEHPGYICFEAAGTLYFATGDYLLTNGGSLYVQVGDATFGASRTKPAVKAIGYPTIVRSIKRDGNNRIYRHVDVTLDLPPGPGYQARPGQRLFLAEPSGIAVKARPILVNQVTIGIGDETALVRVQAASYSAPGDVSGAGDLTSVAPGIAGGTGYRGSGTSQNGWPASPTPSAIGIKSYRIAGSSVSLRMADRAGPTLSYVAQKFHETVEPLVTSDCSGYNYRLIRGSSSTISNHGSGTAIDLNASRHGLARSGTFSAAQVAAIRTILAACKGTVGWGGDYKSRKDEMHFEIIADPVVVSSRTKSIVPRQAVL